METDRPVFVVLRPVAVCAGFALLLQMAACDATPKTAIVLPQLTYQPDFEYPPGQLDARQSGEADVDCEITPRGHTRNCHVARLLGDAAFGGAGLSMATQMVYEPDYANGPSTTIVHTFQFKFEPPDDQITWSDAPVQSAAKVPNSPIVVLPVMNVWHGHVRYPWDLLDHGKTGHIVIGCQVDVRGYPMHCAIRSEEGDAEFGAIALQFARMTEYRPLLAAGKAVVEPNHVFNVRFAIASGPGTVKVPRDKLPRSYAGNFVPNADDAVVDLACAADKSGIASDCRVTAPSGIAAIDAEALAYARLAHYPWVKVNGALIDQPHLPVELIFKVPTTK